MKKKNLAFYFLCIVLLNLVVFGPSLHHMPRSDQIIYLANVADVSDWFSLVIETSTITRTETVYSMPDDLLLRPFLYFISGTEKWLFGYNFMAWQIVSLLLHIGVLWFLLKLLMQTHQSFLAVLLVMLFSVLYPGIEMVIWHTITSYLLFIIFILAVLFDIQEIIHEKIISEKKLAKILVLLTLATLIFEFGALLSILLAFYLYMVLRSPGQTHPNIKRLILFALPGLILLLINYFNVFFHGHTVSKMSQSYFTAANIAHSILLIPNILLWWLFSGVFPTLLDVLARQRTFICPQYILNFEQMRIFTLPVLTGLAVVFSFLFLCAKSCTRSFIKRKGPFLCLLILAMISLAFVISLIRISAKGLISILGTNSYYNYFFWIFFIIFIYNSIAFDEIKTMKYAGRIRLLCIALLSILIVTHSAASLSLNLKKSHADKSFRTLNTQILKLIADHKTARAPSFNIAGTHLKEFIVDWISVRGHPGKKELNIIELLYPQHYTKKNPKFTFLKNTQQEWILKEN